VRHHATRIRVKHCGKAAPHVYLSRMAEAARGGSIDLVEFLLRWKPHLASEAICSACLHGQTALVRHLLSTKITVPPPLLHSLPRNYTYEPLEIAAQNAHCALIDLFVEYSAALTSDLISCAFAGGHGRTYLTVRHLFDAGCTLDRNAIDDCGNICWEYPKYSSGCRPTRLSWSMAPITIAHHLKLISPELLLYFEEGNKVAEDVVGGRLKMPSEPLPFKAMAEEIVEWMKAEEMRLTSRQDSPNSDCRANKWTVSKRRKNPGVQK
jgi:hypothetical protein